MGNLRFTVVITSWAAVPRILEAGSPSVREQLVTIIPEEPQVVLVSCV